MVPGGEKISDISVLGKGGALVGWHGVALLGEGLLSKGKRLWRRWGAEGLMDVGAETGSGILSIRRMGKRWRRFEVVEI